MHGANMKINIAHCFLIRFRRRFGWTSCSHPQLCSDISQNTTYWILNPVILTLLDTERRLSVAGQAFS